MFGFHTTSGRRKLTSPEITSISNKNKLLESREDARGVGPFIRLLQVSDIYSVISTLLGKHVNINWVTRSLCSELNQTILDRIHSVQVKVKAELNVAAVSHLLEGLNNLRSISVLYHRPRNPKPYATDVITEIVQNVLGCIPDLNTLSDIKLFLNKNQPKWNGAREYSKGKTVTLRHLDQCRSLHELQLTYVNKVDLDCIASCASLVVLDLSYTHLPKNTSVLGKLKLLKKLHLTDTRLSDVSSIGCLTSLEELCLNQNPVSDINALSSLTALCTLNLRSTKISDITALAKLVALRVLYVSYTQVSDVTALVNLTSLEELNLSHTRVSNITPLGYLTSLVELDLGHTRVSDVAALANLTALEELYLGYTRVSDITALDNFAALRIYR